jgi:RNA polymerase sigma factor (sigma-70 family)
MANNGEIGPHGGRRLDASFSIVLTNAVLVGIGGLWTATDSVVITLTGTGAVVLLAVLVIVLFRDARPPLRKKTSGAMHDRAPGDATASNGRAASRRSGEDFLTTNGTGARAGQPSAMPDWFERFYIDNFTYLVRTAGRALAAGGLGAQAQDVVNEVFLRAFKNGTWPQPEAALAYFRTAVIRKSISELRRHYQTLPLDDRDSGSAADEVDARIDEAWVREVLDLLPPAQREIMQLVYEGLSGPEIAALLGKGEPNVRSSIRNARARLRPLFPPQSHAQENDETTTLLGEE